MDILTILSKHIHLHFLHHLNIQSSKENDDHKFSRTTKTLQRGEETTPAEKRPAHIMSKEDGAGV